MQWIVKYNIANIKKENNIPTSASGFICVHIVYVVLQVLWVRTTSGAGETIRDNGELWGTFLWQQKLACG